MKRLLMTAAGAFALAMTAQPAFTADIPARAPAYKAPIAAPMLNWTGCYVGVHAGGGWGKKDWGSTVFGDHGDHKVDGWLGGGQIGCDYQTGQWVFGAEGDFSWARLTGDRVDPQFTDDVLHSKVEWLGTATVRVGHVFGAALFYVEGGGAWVRDKYYISCPVCGLANFSNASETRSGWTVGAGIEYALAPNWSAKLEYNYMDFGEDRIQFSCISCLANQRDIDQHIHVVKVGLNYRFATGKAPGPVTTRY